MRGGRRLGTSLGALQNDLVDTLVNAIERRIGVAFVASLRTLFGVQLTIWVSSFVFWLSLIANLRSLGIPIPDVRSSLLFPSILLMYVTNTVVNRVALRHRKILITNFCLCAIAYFLQAWIFIYFYDFLQYLSYTSNHIFPFFPLNSVLSISHLHGPMSRGRPKHQVLALRGPTSQHPEGLSTAIWRVYLRWFLHLRVCLFKGPFLSWV